MTKTIRVAAPFVLKLIDDGDLLHVDTTKASAAHGGYDNVVGPIHSVAFPVGSWNVPDAVAQHWYLLEHASVVDYDSNAPVPPGLSSIQLPR